MKRFSSLWLMLLAFALTGCPHNQYEIVLTPQGKAVERKLLFYCEDGTDTNGVPNYKNFPPKELTEILQLYPTNSATNDGERHTVSGIFAGKLPSDIGGSGTYTNLTNSLGSAGFYAERLRGNDDLAAQFARRIKAADRLTDLVIGWSRMALGHERSYENLRRFLDGDFRTDIKNLSLYGWAVQTSMVTRSGTPEEFAVRFGQYLAERGYWAPEQLPELFRAAEDYDVKPLMKAIQGLVANKLGATKSGAMPPSLAFLADKDLALKSWEDYLRTTDLYRERYRKWQKEKIYWQMGIVKQRIHGFYNPQFRTNSAAKPVTAPQQPDPAEVVDELMAELLNFDFLGTDDHVIVKLTLPAPPTHSNGKWNESSKQLVWESDMETHEKSLRVPGFCYANWSEPNEAVQKEHFGAVILKGDDLSEYCLWFAALDQKETAEWETWLAGLRHGEGMKDKLEAFRFSGEMNPVSTNGPAAGVGISDFPRRLLESAVDGEKH